MEYLHHIIDMVLHLDKHLNELIQVYGTSVYFILFLIVFCETGLVVTPFLPGDSLLFAAGSLAASENAVLSPLWLIVSLSIAAIIGDTVNYHIGKYIGPKAFTGHFRFLKKEHLEKTHKFYEKYGGKTIIFARFIPVIRTFAPFVAGIGAMSYGKFLLYNVIGGLLWVVGFIMAGYMFGQMEMVRKNFSLVILGIIIVSILPGVIEFLRARSAAKKEAIAAGNDAE